MSSKFESPIVIAGAMILVGVLLNVGLFFILAILAPLVSGLVVGFFLGQPQKGTVVGFLGAAISYTLILWVTESLTGYNTELTLLFSAVLLMSLFGSFGGFLGSVIRTRTK
ncbi:MAG: hypothetical protein ACFFCP_01650 [Promethearchaeota archaeon]